MSHENDDGPSFASFETKKEIGSSRLAWNSNFSLFLFFLFSRTELSRVEFSVNGAFSLVVIVSDCRREATVLALFSSQPSDGWNDENTSL